MATSASIISAINAIRSFKNGRTNSPYINLFKKELQSITKRLCKLGVIENKPLNDKSSSFIIDNINIADSQPHIPTIMAAPIIEKITSAKILSLTFEGEIDSFVTGDVDNNDNDCSDTLDLIDSA